MQLPRRSFGHVLVLRPLVLLLAWIALAPVARANVVHIYLVGGQSNADGRAVTSEFPAALQGIQSDVPFYYAWVNSSNVYTAAPSLTTLRPATSETTQSGPELSFGRAMADYHQTIAGHSVALLKFADGGTNLHTQWKAGGNATTTGDGDRYVYFQNTITTGLAALQSASPSSTFKIDGMVWMQGESDADTTTNAGNYQTNLTNFIADVRQTYGSNLPFVIGRLSSGQTAINATNLATVRTAQSNVDAADALTGLVNTDGFGMKTDNLHFSGGGQNALGLGYASQMQTFVAAPEPAGLAAIAASSAVLLARRRYRRP